MSEGRGDTGWRRGGGVHQGSRGVGNGSEGGVVANSVLLWDGGDMHFVKVLSMCVVVSGGGWQW